MRGIEKLMVAAFLGLVALGLWNIRDWLSQYIPASVAALVTPASELKPAAILVTPNKLAATHRKASPRTRTKYDDLTADEVTVVDVPYLGQPFPEPKDLPSGITAAEIRAGFGDPAARITVSSGGELIEKYYYLNRERTRYTIASLRDGRVISAASKPI